MTIDHVNPEFPWPSIDSVREVTEQKAKRLRARLPIYPEFLKGGFISECLEDYVRLISDDSGLVKKEYLDNGA